MTMKLYIFILSIGLIYSSSIYGEGTSTDKYKDHGSGILLSQTMSKADYDMLVKYGMKGLSGQGYNTSNSNSNYEESQDQAVSVEVKYSRPKIKKSRARRLTKKRGMSFSSMALKVNKN